ncbi:hypothetical protein AB0G60_26755 [Streptomyces angustmyceticus]|uniref:Uncharacterized protein n=1 Tax=Streptomyces angustmyceticus TaxID=285578 RepID=A0A5J4LMB8_9ACTN|nr:hypothetical protein [Streptomyces angustmyceticus]UAL65998.1 hypothetical protein K7396_05110 [Streptomyces angustmyceticus]GES33644.1 hypothetical protein San01_61320 [Streptomyces angustmyceticus]
MHILEKGGASIDSQQRAMMTGRERRAADRYHASGPNPLLCRGVESHNFKEKIPMDILTSLLAHVLHLVGWLI